MTSVPQVTVIVLNWNGKEDTLECLDSLSRSDYPNFELVVVDNGSSDGSVEAIRARFGDRVHLIETGKNLGYAGGNNVGIRHALERGSDYVLIINNDTVVAPDFLSRLVATAAEFPQAGILGPKIYYHDRPNVIWSAGGYWDDKNGCFAQVGDGETDEGQYDRVRPTGFLVGCALLVSRRCFEKIGLLEEDFFLNYEEIDFLSRAKQSGFQILYCPSARMWHKISASFGAEHSPLKVYFTYRNRLLWARRHLPAKKRLQIQLSVYAKLFRHVTGPLKHAVRRKKPLKQIVWAVRSSLNSPINRAIARAIVDYHRRRFGNCPPEVLALQARWSELRQNASLDSLG